MNMDQDTKISATRERLDPSLNVNDDEIRAAWEQVGGRGPTEADDLGRVVAQLEGIAVDG